MNKQITVVCGVLYHNGSVLMAQRSEPEQPEAHLKWEFPGGKVDFGETAVQAVEREFREETGIDIAVKKLLPFSQTNYWDYEWGKQQTLCFAFLCELVKENDRPNDHHIEKIDWIPLEKIDMLDSLPGTKEVIVALREELGL